jgi:hypothetical protein
MRCGSGYRVLAGQQAGNVSIHPTRRSGSRTRRQERRTPHAQPQGPLGSVETRSRRRSCKLNSIYKICYFLCNLLGCNLICPTNSDDITDRKSSNARIVVLMQPLYCLPIVFFHLLLPHAPPAIGKVTYHYNIHDRSKGKIYLYRNMLLSYRSDC